MTMLMRRIAVYALPLAIGGILAIFFKVMKVDLDSMSPTIKRGDFVMVARTNEDLGGKDKPRGEVVIAIQQGRYIVKRLIARADDVVETRGRGQLFVNSSFVPTFAAPKPVAGLTQAITRIRVPDGYIFVVGDNTYESVDSRSFGVIPVRSVKGRVILSWRPSLALPAMH